MNYHDTLIEVADDCPATKAQVPHARGAKKTKAVVEYQLLIQHPYTCNEEDIAFQVYAALHDIPKATWPTERKKILSKGHPAPSRVAARQALRLGHPQQRRRQDRADRR